jgi:hypothetical protein
VGFNECVQFVFHVEPEDNDVCQFVFHVVPDNDNICWLELRSEVLHPPLHPLEEASTSIFLFAQLLART